VAEIKNENDDHRVSKREGSFTKTVLKIQRKLFQDNTR
jgi:hypothetical protein